MEKSSYVLGSELWESKFDGLLSLDKEYIIDVWEIRNINYMIVTQDPVNNSILGLHLGRGMVSSVRMVKFVQNGKFGQNGKLGHSCTKVTKGKLYGSRDSDHVIVYLGFKCKQLRP